MAVDKSFFAYPSYPNEIGQTIRAAAEELDRYHAGEPPKLWEELEIPGRFIADTVLQGIDDARFLFADITSLNFNVTYEIGFALGRGYRVVIVANEPYFAKAKEKIRELGIFDTLGYQTYQNAKGLAAILRGSFTNAIGSQRQVDRKSPVYVTEDRWKTDGAIRILARVKKSRLPFRTFNPAEQSRLSPFDAISHVSRSYGVLVHLVSTKIQDSEISNLRAAFIAGLAQGMDRILLILQQGNDPVPLDYRDLVNSYDHPEKIDEFVADFAGRVYEAMESLIQASDAAEKTAIEALILGASSAENELRELQNYYLATDEFRRALRGEVRLVVGRKGSGKTAVFLQVRDKVRSSKDNVVLDLKPDGFRLLKFRDRVLALLARGSAEHTITAFWEVLLLLELAHKVLENDQHTYKTNSDFLRPYRELVKSYKAYGYEAPGDFAERMSILLNRIEDDFKQKYGDAHVELLPTGEITALIHHRDIRTLENALVEYLGLKNDVWILFDNIDQGWSGLGVTDSDLVIVKGLLEATRKIERLLQRRDISAHTLLFLRSDIYDLLINTMPDRGKDQRAFLDWRDPDLLRRLVLRRITFFAEESIDNFDDVWATICVKHIDGEESSQFLIDRCLMRPRFLIDLINHCRGVAVTMGHDRIEQDDIRKGLRNFSSDLVADLGHEIRDVFEKADGALYAFYGRESELSDDDVRLHLMEAQVRDEDIDRVISLLLWYGFLGVFDDNQEPRFIYQVNYDPRLLDALKKKRPATVKSYQINPAFWSALEVKHY